MDNRTSEQKLTVERWAVYYFVAVPSAVLERFCARMFVRFESINAWASRKVLGTEVAYSDEQLPDLAPPPISKRWRAHRG